VRRADLRIDVTDAVGLGEPAHIALTVVAPGEVTAAEPGPIVCFAKPGAGYSRGYFTEDLPGPGHGIGSQADWHAARGWIFVAVDHLGVGESSLHESDIERLTFSVLVVAAQAAETEVRQRLEAGTLLEGLAPVEHPVTVGLGQSMGGSLTILQQGRHHCYDGIGVLGYSALHTQPPTAPGTPELALPWVPRDTMPSEFVFTNGPALAEAGTDGGGEDGAGEVEVANVLAWGFHYDDVDAEVVRRDLDDYPARRGQVPAWGSATIPMTVAMWCLSPGSVLTEAAAVRAPVLVAFGERDVLVDPRGEVRAYESAASVDVFECPKMAHMHNFAGTRELFWRRIETWAQWVRAVREDGAARGGGDGGGAGRGGGGVAGG
jgi:pimeloyl-ACP methyl ester carboxylesterase